MNTGSVALALSALALAAGVFALTRESPQPQRAPQQTKRVTALERQVADLSREVASLRAARRKPIVPEIPGSAPTAPLADAGDAGGVAAPSDHAAKDTGLEAIVDDAVDRKVEELRIKANKKPEMTVFASMLELTKQQRAEAERVVVQGQHEVHAILNIPMASGANLMDQLVEIAARGFARPGKDHGFRKWVAHVLAEKIPGTNDTYGGRIESVKQAMRATFKRDWTKAQYREFEEWKVDPTEIRNVPGSPNVELVRRITERARALGAVIPDDK